MEKSSRPYYTTNKDEEKKEGVGALGVFMLEAGVISQEYVDGIGRRERARDWQRRRNLSKKGGAPRAAAGPGEKAPAPGERRDHPAKKGGERRKPRTNGRRPASHPAQA